MTSKPYLSAFNPALVPKQLELIRDVRKRFDYAKGSHEVLLCGGLGSSKSLLLSHLVVTHCLFYPGARACLGRRTMPDLKATILREVLEHIEEDLEEGKDYGLNRSSGQINFANGSEIICRSWAGGRSKKSRSMKLSMLVIEEITENNLDDMKAIKELRMRVGRIDGWGNKENLFIAATNPDDPQHWVRKYFYESGLETRHAYEFSPFDNPFLPDWYIPQLQAEMDPKTARRMIYGEWLELDKSVIYHAYRRELNYRDSPYTINPQLPIGLTFDFNIGEGKPMSCALFQYDGTAFHFFNQSIIHGARTQEVMEDLAGRGLLDHKTTYWIHGDATGKSRSTKSLHSDYEVIKDFLNRYRKPDQPAIQFELKVPNANPPIRTRHNTVNAYCRNDLGQTRLYVYKDAKTIDEGMRLTALKTGGSYAEDDSKPYQHVTTAVGYAITYIHNEKSKSHATFIKR